MLSCVCEPLIKQFIAQKRDLLFTIRHRFIYSFIYSFLGVSLPDVHYSLSKLPEELHGDLLFDHETALFGTDLDQIMQVQRTLSKKRNKNGEANPTLDVPRVLIELIDATKRLGGYQTEGIFRVPASFNELEGLKRKMIQNNAKERKEDYKDNNMESSLDVKPNIVLAVCGHNASPHLPAGYVTNKTYCISI